MKLKFCSAIAFVALLVCYGSAVAQSVVSNTPYLDIQGVVTTHLNEVAQAKDEPWVLLKVVSDEYSGAATISGTATISGRFEVDESLGYPVHVLSGKYSWTQPNEFPISAAVSGAVNSNLLRWYQCGLFAGQFNGMRMQSATRHIMCILHDRSTGQDMFEQVHYVPDAWVNFLSPAVIYLRAHPLFWDSDANNPQLSGTRLLLNDPNPYLALSAFQCLALGHDLTRQDIIQLLSSHNITLISACIVALRDSGWLEQDENGSWFLGKIAEVKGLDQMLGIVQGIDAAARPDYMAGFASTGSVPVMPPPEHVIEFNKSLFGAIRLRLNEIAPNALPDDPEWRIIDRFCKEHGV